MYSKIASPQGNMKYWGGSGAFGFILFLNPVTPWGDSSAAGESYPGEVVVPTSNIRRPNSIKRKRNPRPASVCTILLALKVQKVPREAKKKAAQTCGRHNPPRETLTGDKTRAVVRRDVNTPVPKQGADHITAGSCCSARLSSYPPAYALRVTTFASNT